jgi:hypothetical protein
LVRVVDGEGDLRFVAPWPAVVAGHADDVVTERRRQRGAVDEVDVDEPLDLLLREAGLG